MLKPSKQILSVCLLASLVQPAVHAAEKNTPPAKADKVSLKNKNIDLKKRPAPTKKSEKKIQMIRIQGKVINAQSKGPIREVYIRQKGSLNATFVSSSGEFQLDLHPGFPLVVAFHADGFETLTFRFENEMSDLAIAMHPQVKYTTNVPQEHQSKPEPKQGLFSSQFTAFYQGGFRSLNTPNANVGGFTLNELGLSGDVLLFKPLAFRGRFYRGRMPVNVENFDFNPAFFNNTLFAKLGSGYLWTVNESAEIYLGGDLYFENRSPDNRSAQDQRPVPFTGTIMDFEQNRLGLGVSAAMAWKLHERLVIYPELTLYPGILNFVKNQDKNPTQYMVGGDLGLKMRLEIIPGVYAVAQYNKQMSYGFQGNYFDNADNLHLGLSLDPWTMAETLR